MIDIHNRKRQLERCLERLEKPPISHNNALILKFKDDCCAEGLSEGRIVRCIDHLTRLSEFLGKDFDEANKEDIKKLVSKVETAKSRSGNKELSVHTKHAIKIVLKKFYKWLKGTDEYPEEVKWFKCNIKNNNHKIPSDMLTEEDIKALINAALNPRDKAFISTLYESGCRISELMNLRIKDIKFDDIGAQIYVTGKTGFRRVRLVSSVPYLQEWLNRHQQKDNLDSFVWIKNDGAMLGYNRVRYMLQDIKKRSGIKKEVHPHNFRHSRATYLANFLTEAQMKEFFGWTQSSDMAAVYVHISGRDVDNALLKTYGIKKEEKKQESTLIPQRCARCEQTNEATNKFCKRCGLPLDEETKRTIIKEEMDRKQADQVMEELVKDKEILGLLLRKITEKKLIAT